MGVSLGLGLGADALFGAGAAEVGAGALGAADIAGTGALLGPTALGTAGAFLDPAAAGLASAATSVGPTAFGTALDFLGGGAAAGAGALGAGLAGGAEATGVFPGALPGASPGGSPFTPGANNAPITAPGVTGATGPVTGPAPSAGIPGGASPVGGPAGASPVDFTSDATLPSGSTPTAGTSPFDTGTTPVNNLGGLPTNTPAPPAAPPGGANSGILNSIGTFLKSPSGVGLQALLAGGGLGYNLLNQNKQEKATQAQITGLENQATAKTAAADAAAAPTLQEGQLLTSYLTTGQLPAPMQAQIDQATKAAKAAAISRAAAQGLSSDPAQNSALAQQLASIDQQALVTKGQQEQQLQQAGTQMISTANSLIAQGLSATELDTQLAEFSIQLDQKLSASTGQAIANFAAALGGQQFKQPTQQAA